MNLTCKHDRGIRDGALAQQPALGARVSVDRRCDRQRQIVGFQPPLKVQGAVSFGALPRASDSPAKRPNGLISYRAAS